MPATPPRNRLRAWAKSKPTLAKETATSVGIYGCPPLDIQEQIVREAAAWRAEVMRMSSEAGARTGRRGSRGDYDPVYA
jgi:hypothetical protein